MATPIDICELAHCCAVFLPADPARAGRVAFWRPDGRAPPAVPGAPVEDLTVVLPLDGDVAPVTVPAVLLPLRAALPVLTRAEHVVHYDRWWNPAVEAQATDRAYRIGQSRPVQVHRLIAEGAIEDRIADLLHRKRDLAEAVLGAGEAALTELTDAELADLVELGGGPR